MVALVGTIITDIMQQTGQRFVSAGQRRSGGRSRCQFARPACPWCQV